MSLVNILTLVCSIATLLSALIVYGLHRNMREFERTKNDIGINSTRERIEDQIYRAQQLLLIQQKL